MDILFWSNLSDLGTGLHNETIYRGVTKLRLSFLVTGLLIPQLKLPFE